MQHLTTLNGKLVSSSNSLVTSGAEPETTAWHSYVTVSQTTISNARALGASSTHDYVVISNDDGTAKASLFTRNDIDIIFETELDLPNSWTHTIAQFANNNTRIIISDELIYDKIGGVFTLKSNVANMSAIVLAQNGNVMMYTDTSSSSVKVIHWVPGTDVIVERPIAGDMSEVSIGIDQWSNDISPDGSLLALANQDWDKYIIYKWDGTTYNKIQDIVVDIGDNDYGYVDCFKFISNEQAALVKTTGKNENYSSSLLVLDWNGSNFIETSPLIQAVGVYYSDISFSNNGNTIAFISSGNSGNSPILVWAKNNDGIYQQVSHDIPNTEMVHYLSVSDDAEEILCLYAGYGSEVLYVLRKGLALEFEDPEPLEATPVTAMMLDMSNNVIMSDDTLNWNIDHTLPSPTSYPSAITKNDVTSDFIAISESKVYVFDSAQKTWQSITLNAGLTYMNPLGVAAHDNKIIVVGRHGNFDGATQAFITVIDNYNTAPTQNTHTFIDLTGLNAVTYGKINWQPAFVACGDSGSIRYAYESDTSVWDISLLSYEEVSDLTQIFYNEYHQTFIARNSNGEILSAKNNQWFFGGNGETMWKSTMAPINADHFAYDPINQNYAVFNRVDTSVVIGIHDPFSLAWEWNDPVDASELEDMAFMSFVKDKWVLGGRSGRILLSKSGTTWELTTALNASHMATPAVYKHRNTDVSFHIVNGEYSVFHLPPETSTEASIFSVTLDSYATNIQNYPDLALKLVVLGEETTDLPLVYQGNNIFALNTPISLATLGNNYYYIVIQTYAGEEGIHIGKDGNYAGLLPWQGGGKSMALTPYSDAINAASPGTYNDM